MERTVFFLDQKEMPTSWYNILPDLPEPFPAYISPVTGKPATPQELGRIFPMELIKQEVCLQASVCKRSLPYDCQSCRLGNHN